MLFNSYTRMYWLIKLHLLHLLIHEYIVCINTISKSKVLNSLYFSLSYKI